MLYDKNSTRIKGWCRYTNDMGSLEDNNEISEDSNISSVDYGYMSPIVVVTEFMSSEDFMGLISL